MLTRSLATSLSALVTLALVAGVPACSSAGGPEVDSSDNAVSQGGPLNETTTAFAGSFEVQADSLIKVEFNVTKIDWRGGKARWNATFVARNGAPIAANHVNVDVPMKLAVARCPGCFTLTAQEENAGELVRIDVTNGNLAAIRYVDIPALRPTLSTDGEGEGAGGSCALSCEGQAVECSEGGTEATCASKRFGSLPRCPYLVAFSAKSCADRSNSPAKGSCSVLCEGTAADCVANVTEAQCKGSSFGSLPRCPHSFNFVPNATCR